MIIETIERNGNDYILKEDIQRWLEKMAVNSGNSQIIAFAEEASEKIGRIK